MTEPVQGQKFDTGKPRFSLLPKGVLTSILRVLEYGANKYRVDIPVDFHTFKHNLEDFKWQEQVSANPAERLKVSCHKGYVPHATEIQPLSLQSVQTVNNSENFLQKQVNVDLVMRNKDCQTNLKNLLLKGLIEKHILSETAMQGKSEKETGSVESVQSMLRKRNEGLLSEILQSTGCQNTSIEFFVNVGVQSAEAQNAHILTTIIQQGSLEICCVVSAIKVLDCYKTMLLLLETFLHTSPNIQLVKEYKTGIDNWQHVENPRERYYDAAMRHLYAWFNGESKDLETGESHLAHAICCLLFLLWFESN